MQTRPSTRESSLESRKETLPASPGSEQPEKFNHRDRVLAEFDRFGIHEPARSRLAAMAHVTPALVRGHCQTAQTTGLAIFRIEHNWEVKGLAFESPGQEDPAGYGLESEDSEAGGEAAEEDSLDLPAPCEECQAAWNEALERLRGEISAADFVTWVKPARLLEAGELSWMASLANRFAVERFIERGWAARLGQILSEQRGESINVQLVVGY